MNIIKLVAVLLSGLLYGSCTAQSSAVSPSVFDFNGGIILGPTLSQIHGDGIGGFNKLGFHAGVVVEIKSDNKKAIQLGVVYNEKGSRKTPNPQAGDNSTWAYRYRYMDLPVSLLYSYDNLEFIIGLQPSMLISADYDDGLTGYQTSTWEIYDWDLGWIIGLRTKYGDHSILYSRLTQSAIATAPAVDNPLTWDRKTRNMTLEFGVVYLIGSI